MTTREIILTLKLINEQTTSTCSIYEITINRLEYLEKENDRLRKVNSQLRKKLKNDKKSS